jgi:AcrR family transcriptional regulator
MKSGVDHAAKKRIYRQGARAAASAETYRRVVEAFLARMETLVFDEITLDSVAAAAGVTVQTVIRRFASKEGLLRAAAESLGKDIQLRRAVSHGGTAALIKALVDDYEITGDLTIRLLAQEQHSAISEVLALGRRFHRQWVREGFRGSLALLPRAARERHLAGLLVLTDVYTWKLLRRDQEFSAAATAAVILELVEASLGAITRRVTAEKGTGRSSC